MPSSSVYFSEDTLGIIDQILKDEPRFRSRSGLLDFLVHTYAQSTEFRPIGGEAIQVIQLQLADIKQSLLTARVVGGGEPYEDSETKRRGVDIVNRILDED